MKLELTVTLNKRWICGLILYVVLRSIASVPLQNGSVDAAITTDTPSQLATTGQ